MEFTGRVNNYWTFGGSWTVSYLTGNDEGGDQNNYSFMDTSATDAHLHWSLRQSRGITRDDVSPYGALNNNAPQHGRLYALLQLPIGKGSVNFSWSLRYDSAKSGSFGYYRPYTAFGGQNVANIPYPDGQVGPTGPLNVAGRPTTWYNFYDSMRGQYKQGNDYYNCDFKTSFAVPMTIPGMGDRVQLIGELMVFNLFNHTQNTGLRFATINDTTNGMYAFAIDTEDGYQYDNGFGKTDPYFGSYWRYMRNFSFSVGLKF
jgi:hypothetical protein